MGTSYCRRVSLPPSTRTVHVITHEVSIAKLAILYRQDGIYVAIGRIYWFAYPTESETNMYASSFVQKLCLVDRIERHLTQRFLALTFEGIAVKP